MVETTASALLALSNANATRFHPSSPLPQSNNESTQIGHSGSQVAVLAVSHYTSAPTTPLSSILHTSLPASRPASTEYTQQPSSNAVVQNRIDAHQTTQHVATPISDEAQDNQNASSSIDLENDIAQKRKILLALAFAAFAQCLRTSSCNSSTPKKRIILRYKLADLVRPLKPKANAP